MPYIKKEKRKIYDDYIDKLSKFLRKDPTNLSGNLNYITTMLIEKSQSQEWNYDRMNSMVGFLECCKNEFYRKRVSPYEDSKIKIEGDVYN